jgi:hypothetical protein
MKSILKIVILFSLFSVFFHPACKDKDTTPPVITILGDNPLFYPLGVPYVDPGATAEDDQDGDITAKIKTTIDVDVNVQAYNYHVYYDVEDAAGNKAKQAVRIVHVLQM